MNCDEFNQVIDSYVDNELDDVRKLSARDHEAACGDCAVSCEELRIILAQCRGEATDEALPPNSQAMWLRINNVIENEIRAEKQKMPLPEPPKRRFWQLSFPQLAAAIGCIAIVSSLLTIAAIRNYTQPATGEFAVRSAATQSTFEKVLAKVGLIETVQQSRDRRIKEQQAAIDYWNARVQMRRVQWDAATRDAFDRNLRVINESVHDYTSTLQQDPEDELSGEMLDAVLDDKMNLLRDFSEL